MADTVRISELPAASSAISTDVYPVVQGGVTKKESVAQLLIFMNANIGIAESQVTNLTSDLAARLLKASNLSDLTNAATARTNLGVAIGTNVEAWNASLDQIAAGTWTGASSITTLGAIATGTWQGTVIAGQYGGTGVANTGKTITLAGNLVTAGAFSLTLTTSAATNVTLPTTGTLVPTTGTGATGTWNISISGNAATATLASTVTTNANLTGDVTSSGNATTYAGIVPVAKGGSGISSAPANGAILIGSSGGYEVNWINNVAGQTTVTNGAGSITIGLATAGTASTYGSATQVPVFTTDAYGRVTAVTNTTLTNGITSQSDGFTITSGSTPRTLTVTSANVTLNQSLSTSSSPSFSQFNSTIGTSSGGNIHAGFLTSGNLRWAWGLIGSESTSNAGSNFVVWRYADNGLFLDQVYSIERSSGKVCFGTTASYNGLYNFFAPNTAVNTAALAGQFYVASTDSQAADVGATVYLGGSNGSANVAFASVCGRKFNSTSANSRGYLTFNTTDNAGTLAERMRITDAAVTVNTPTTFSATTAISTSAAGAYMLTIGNSSATGNGLICDIASTSSAQPVAVFRGNSGTTTAFVANADGSIIMPNTGTGAGTALVVTGGGNVVQLSSSLRYKKDVVDFSANLSKLEQLRPVSYVYKNDNSADFGLIAEEVYEILPELVNLNAGGLPESVKYSQLSVMLLSAMQQLGLLKA